MYMSNLALSQNLSIEGYLNINSSLPSSKIEQPPNTINSASTGYSSVLVNANHDTLEMRMRQGFTAGAVVGYRLNQRLELFSGLEFSLLRYKQKYSESGLFASSLISSGFYSVSSETALCDPWEKVQLGILNVPLDLRINLKKAFYFKIGISMDYLLFVKQRKQELYWKRNSSSIVQTELTEIWQFSELIERERIIKGKKSFSELNATIRAGIGYELNDKFSLELGYYRQVKSLYNAYESTVDMSYIELGIRIKLMNLEEQN